MKRVFTFTCFLFLTIGLLGCSAGTAPGVATDMTGTWSSTFTNRADGNSKTDIRLQLEDAGTVLSGNATIANSPSPITGTRNGASFEFSFDILGVNTTVTGQTTSATTFVGTYDAGTGANGPVAAVRAAE